MAMRGNWFDEKWASDYVPREKASIDDKVNSAMSVITKSAEIRNRVKEVIEDFDRRESPDYKGPKIMGPTISQAVRMSVAEVLNADVLE